LNCISAFLQSQFDISGIVKDKKGNAVIVGDVVLKMDNGDDEIVKFSYINEGKFIIESVDEGKYLIQISALGFQDFKERFILNKNRVFSVILNDDTTALDEIVVTHKRKIFEREGGKLSPMYKIPLLS